MYFVAIDNKKEGPLTFDEVLNLKLTDEVMIWKEGMSDWTKVTDLPEFQKFIFKTPPPLPFEIRNRKKKEFKTERTFYAGKTFLRNALIGFILAIILDLIITAYAKTGGTIEHHIFLTHEEREHPSIIFWAAFPYCLLIGEFLLLLIATIQVIIFRPQRQIKNSSANDFDQYQYYPQRRDQHTTYRISEQTQNFLLGIGATIAIFVIFWLYSVFCN